MLHAGATMSLVNDEALPVVRGAIGELFWSISDAVIIHHEGRVLAWNPAAERVFGVTSQEATAPEFDLDAIFGSSAPELARLLADGGSGPLDARSGLAGSSKLRRGSSETSPVAGLSSSSET